MQGSLTFVIFICWLVNDSTMFETAQIKHAHAAISSTADKDVDTVGTKANIVYFFIVGNQLRLRRECRDIPDGASRVNAGRNDQAWGDGVPVQRSDRGSMLGRFRIRQQGQWRQLGGGKLPLVRRACNRIGLQGLWRWQ